MISQKPTAIVVPDLRGAEEIHAKHKKNLRQQKPTTCFFEAE